VVSERIRARRLAIAASGLVACVTGGLVWAFIGNADPFGAQTNCPNTAAETHNWGVPKRDFEFDNPASLDEWWLYDGPSHTGNGRRTPAAINVADGLVTITGDQQGNSGGMAPKGPGQKYGRWEVCAKSPSSAPTYHSVLLLWPDAENWPVGGEIDFTEISDPQRQNVEAWLHFGPDDQRQGTVVPIDATQWHSWAVEWTHDHIATYVDGVQWWQTTDASHFPPGLMHLCMQVDDFGGDTRGGGQQIVDWAREYQLGG
jgi:licheninase